jgi:DNA-binding MarR family transcriptional regulator
MFSPVALSVLELRILEYADHSPLQFNSSQIARTDREAPGDLAMAAESLVFRGLLERRGHDSRGPVPYLITRKGTELLRH